VIGLDTLKSAGLPRPPAADTERRMEGMRKDFAGSTREMVKAMFFRPDADPALVQRIAEDMSQAPPEVAIPSVQALNAWDGVRAMADVRVPIVAINSDLGPPTQEERIRGFAPTFRAVVVPGTGHFLMMEDPARLNPIIDAQIRGLP
jgi:pimeloyl-ACP methyl ester carboxylesterase